MKRNIYEARNAPSHRNSVTHALPWSWRPTSPRAVMLVATNVSAGRAYGVKRRYPMGKPVLTPTPPRILTPPISSNAPGQLSKIHSQIEKVTLPTLSQLWPLGRTSGALSARQLQTPAHLAFPTRDSHVLCWSTVPLQQPLRRQP